MKFLYLVFSSILSKSKKLWLNSTYSLGDKNLGIYDDQKRKQKQRNHEGLSLGSKICGFKHDYKL